MWFQSTGVRRNIRFLGLAVPGALSLSADEDLVAVWRTSAGQRFQNYRATFTVLAAPVVSRRWLDAVLAGSPVGPDAPDVFRRWVATGDYVPLVAPKVGETRTREEQLPDTREGEAVVDAVYQACRASPVTFEQVAAELWRLVARGRMEMSLTRPTQDGGRDAVGSYFLGPVDDQISLEFSLEAKCYAPAAGVGVRDVARLVSRIRHREFGVFVTTSYVAEQAYREIREDGHPIVFLVGRDIAQILRAQGITRPADAAAWTQAVLARPFGPYAGRGRKPQAP